MSLPSRIVSRPVIAVLVAVVLLAGAALLFTRSSGRTTATGVFDRVVGLYTGDEVRVLGVPVGTVASITNKTDGVHVTVEYDHDVQVPAGAKMAVIAPTLVAERYVQLTPAYTGGPTMADGTVIPKTRTAVPVEWDQIKQQLDRAVTDLGPGGQGDLTGPLGHALDTTAANLDGNGQAMADTIRGLAAAMTTLSDGRGDLFATVDNLRRFSETLRDSDSDVRQVTDRLASVSGVLAANREQLGTALTSLDQAFRDMSEFADTNGKPLVDTSRTLDAVVGNIAENRQPLADVLQILPTTLTNFYNIYDSTAGTLNGTLAANNFESPAQFICSTLFSLGAPPDQCRTVLKPWADLAKLTAPPVKVTPLERPGSSNQRDLPPGAATADPTAQQPQPGGLPTIGGGPAPTTVQDLLPGAGR